MACIFCDQTPETANAVAALAQMKIELEIVRSQENHLKGIISDLRHELYRVREYNERLRKEPPQKTYSDRKADQG